MPAPARSVDKKTAHSSPQASAKSNAPAAAAATSSSSSSSSSSDSDSSSSDDDDDAAAASSPPPPPPGSIRLFSASSPRRERMQLHYIDTVEGMAPALATIRASSRLSVDCEGVALSRTGTICLVQVSTACDPVTRLYHCFLFDVVALGASTFTTGLGAILSAPTPVKLFYDMRRDSEALFHQFGIHLRGVCDMQLMELASRRARNQSVVYLPGLARLLGDRFTDLDAELQAVKDGMSGKYEQQPDLWQRRPLTKEQTIYAAVDVVLLHLLLDELITPPKDKLKDHGAAPPAATAAAAAQAEADAATAAAATVTSLSPSDSQEVVSRPVARSAMYVNEQTRQLVEQYSEIVWSASIRDLDGEPDLWSRRHVPLDFQHAAFPLSLSAACAAVQAARDAREQARREAEEQEQEAAADKKKKKQAKRKGTQGDVEEKKIAASFSAAAAAAAADAASAAAKPAESAASSSLSSFVQRLSRTPAARSHYSGLANTLKHMRKQTAAAAAASGAAPAAIAAASSDKQQLSGSKRKGRQVPQAADVPSTSSSSSSKKTAAAAAAAPRVPALRVGSIVGNPAAFHPQLTPAVVAGLTKQGQASQPTMKKQKISHAF